MAQWLGELSAGLGSLVPDFLKTGESSEEGPGQNGGSATGESSEEEHAEIQHWTALALEMEKENQVLERELKALRGEKISQEMKCQQLDSTIARLVEKERAAITFVQSLRDKKCVPCPVKLPALTGRESQSQLRFRASVEALMAASGVS